MAKWVGEWYKRINSQTWRNRRTGRVSSSPTRLTGKVETEPRGYHTYGRDIKKPYLKKPIYVGMPKALRKNLFKK